MDDGPDHGAISMSYHPGPSASLIASALSHDDKLPRRASRRGSCPNSSPIFSTARDRLRAMGVPIASERAPEPLDPIEELVGPNPWKDDD